MSRSASSDCYAYAALDPGEQLLQAPVLAAPVALKRAGLSLPDMEVVEMHEAFAAQVLSNLQGFESKMWAARAGLTTPLGEVDRSRLNQMGGSIAIGHPFGATGARILTTLCHELRRRDGQFGLMTVVLPVGSATPWWSSARDANGCLASCGRPMRRPYSSNDGRPLMPALSIEVRDDIAIVTFDQPGSPVNVITASVRDEFAALLDRLDHDQGVRAAVLLSGKPDNWIAGADIEELAELDGRGRGAPERARPLLMDRVELAADAVGRPPSMARVSAADWSSPWPARTASRLRPRRRCWRCPRWSWG